ncbi:hypothetical protein L484_005538 [Morus notabilis]|uniref:Uncharacterized protein n=1 Tax=Morus notabilis TaxID=981085 RepID=W9QF27_9ROSA|nr:hypothetical protein L484_005538 [Morus notabilis]
MARALYDDRTLSSQKRGQGFCEDYGPTAPPPPMNSRTDHPTRHRAPPPPPFCSFENWFSILATIMIIITARSVTAVIALICRASKIIHCAFGNRDSSMLLWSLSPKRMLESLLVDNLEFFSFANYCHELFCVTEALLFSSASQFLVIMVIFLPFSALRTRAVSEKRDRLRARFVR